jgi:Xaa-Pro aminopeptidase
MQTHEARTAHAPDPREAVGARYEHAAMLAARDRGFAALRDIAAGIRPGMTEGQARTRVADVLAAHGVERLWHPNIVRFGTGTLKTFRQVPDPELVLGEHDIYFIDIGPVWDGHEGDVGDTYVVGDDPEMHACAAAARELFARVARHWREHGVSGVALYDHAAREAESMGWHFNLSIKGHRVGDYPHSIHKGGSLGDYAGTPRDGLWILEIQIAHRLRPFGAFYEDLLTVATG